ncbi:MAG: hypothetical protein KC708_18810 [Anaerolineae bacterium]|nr:hypothetical protein [Anaerolineae bacterium]
MTLGIGELLEIITRDIDEAAQRIHKERDRFSEIGEVEITVNLEVDPDDEAVDPKTGTVIDADKLRESGFRFSRIGVSRRQPVDLSTKKEGADSITINREAVDEAAKAVESRIRRLPAETRDVVRPLIQAHNELVSAEMGAMRAELNVLRNQLTTRAAGDDTVDNSGTNLAIRVVVIPQIDE